MLLTYINVALLVCICIYSHPCFTNATLDIVHWYITKFTIYVQNFKAKIVIVYHILNSMIHQ
jgi:hypothetical protein